jgi:hypothetical protein
MGAQTLSLPTGKLAQGVCFARISSGAYSVTKKIIVLR